MLRSNGAPLPYYLTNFIADVLRLVLTVIALVEAIFLAERFPMVFRDVLKNNASGLDAAMIFACSSTQIFDLALPIAILVAVYMTTVRMREDRELLVFAAAGIGPFRLLALALIIGATALASSLLVSSAIDPISRYAQRVILFDAEFRALKEGINTGQFHYFSDKVAFAPARSATIDRGQSRNLFVYQELNPETFRVITAETVRLDGPYASGMVRLRLDGFSSSVFSTVRSSTPVPSQADADAPADSPDADASNGGLSAGDVVQELRIDDLLPFPPRGDDLKEMTLVDQLRGPLPDDPARRRVELRLLGERFARSLLCLLAPLLALVSVSLTTRATHHSILPLACLALMALNVTSAWLIKVIAPSAPFWALSLPVAVSAVFAVPLILWVTRAQGQIIRPQRSRA